MKIVIFSTVICLFLDFAVIQVETSPNPVRDEIGEMTRMLKPPNLKRQDNDVYKILTTEDMDKLFISAVHYDPTSSELNFMIETTNLTLIAVIEGRLRGSELWQVVKEISINQSVNHAMLQKTTLDLSKIERERIDPVEKPDIDLRVKICTQNYKNTCTSYVKPVGADSTSGVNVGIISIYFIVISAALYLTYKNLKKRATSNNYKINSMLGASFDVRSTRENPGPRISNLNQSPYRKMSGLPVAYAEKARAEKPLPLSLSGLPEAYAEEARTERPLPLNYELEKSTYF